MGKGNTVEEGLLEVWGWFGKFKMCVNSKINIVLLHCEFSLIVDSSAIQ